jgi:hypothetical protein
MKPYRPHFDCSPCAEISGWSCWKIASFGNDFCDAVATWAADNPKIGSTTDAEPINAETFASIYETTETDQIPCAQTVTSSAVEESKVYDGNVAPKRVLHLVPATSQPFVRAMSFPTASVAGKRKAQQNPFFPVSGTTNIDMLALLCLLIIR